MANRSAVTLHAPLEQETEPTAGRSPARSLLQRLIETGIILLEEWQALAEELRHRLLDTPTCEELLPLLTEADLLTSYQAAHVLAGGMDQLVFGNYRILERIGVGGMGVVYRGEHMLMRRPVALKVLQSSTDDDEILLKRFFVEMRVLARMRHPNIVGALDAGRHKPAHHETGHLHYLVMEYVTGTNIEDMVERECLSVARACDLIYQIAGALEETHRCHLIHRDIKPSNILVTEDNVAKLLDFGLALHFGRRRLTHPGTLLGTLSYMAPEQAVDSANVDIRADIFGLGATLFFSLTGQPPFAAQGNLTQQIATRFTQPAPEVRKHRPDVPVELETVIRRMMAHHRDDRLATPRAVMRALLPFVTPVNRFGIDPHAKTPASAPLIALPPEEAGTGSVTPAAPRILIVDDEELIRRVCTSFFRHERFECQEAGNGEDALRLLAEHPFDLVVLDIDMPKLSGTETLRRLRRPAPVQQPEDHHGLGRSFSRRVVHHARTRRRRLPGQAHRSAGVGRPRQSRPVAQGHAGSIRATQPAIAPRQCRAGADAAEPQQRPSGRTQRIGFRTRENRRVAAQETGAHLTRLTRFVTTLARRARHAPRLAAMLDKPFLQTLEACTLLHDIGNVAMPDHVLRRDGGRLDPEDLIILQAHTSIGAETLQTVAKRDRGAAAFWQMAMDIARHHHENFDGSGYPDHLAGNDIPLAARLVALVDAYDTLRSGSTLGVALSHNAAAAIILEGSSGRFDPLLVSAFQQSEADFDNIFRACPDREFTPLTIMGPGAPPQPARAGFFDPPDSMPQVDL